MSADLLPAIRAAASGLTPDERDAPVLVGVSGGPDSLALLHALGRWRDEDGPTIAAVHVDHRLRPESADEARQVAAWCAEWGIPFSGQIAGLDRVPEANKEQVAREARYRCFAEEAARIGALTLALGHHVDDQAETLLLHLLRGSGLAGLVGMPGIRRSGDLLDPICAALGVSRPAVWRPLLIVRRAETLAYCERWQLAPIHDPSNDVTTLRRNAIRQRIMPLLEENFPGAGGTLARNAALLAADEDFMQAATDQALTPNIQERALSQLAQFTEGIATFDRDTFRKLPPALQRRTLRATWGRLRDRAALIGLNASTIEVARIALLSGKTGARHALPGELLLILDRDTAAVGPIDTLETRLRRRFGGPQVEVGWSSPLPTSGMLMLGTEWALEAMMPAASHVPADAVSVPMDSAARFSFRTWQPGDRITLPDGHSRKLQDWFTDHRVPAYVRHHLPLLACGNRVLWIVGLAVSPPASLETPGEEVISCRLLYNGTPVELVRRR